jgi:hypothetical protein
VQTGEQRAAWWYVLDEVGTALTHADVPNARCVPLVDPLNGENTMSLLFPILTVQEGGTSRIPTCVHLHCVYFTETITRDFVEGKPADQRSLYLLPWFESDFTATTSVVSPLLTKEHFEV